MRTLLVALLLGTPLSATADDPKAAHALFEEATKAYNVGEYQKALDAYRAGYYAKPDPAFLFNMGQCYRMLGQWETAARQYAAFLRERPDAPNRPQVEQFIEDCHKELQLLTEKPPTTVERLAPQAEEHARKPPPTITTAPTTTAPTTSKPRGDSATATVPSRLSSHRAPATTERPLTAAPRSLTATPKKAVPTETATAKGARRRWWPLAIGGAVVVVGAVVGILVAALTPNNASIPPSDLGATALHF